MRRLVSALASALLAGAALLAAPAGRAGGEARADVIPSGEILRSGQSFAGDVPPGETLRFKVELAAGGRLRLSFSLRVPGTGLYLPANFQRVSVLGPDGAPVPFDAAHDSTARYDPRRRLSTFRTLDWPAPVAGTYTFSITHLSQTTTSCLGRVKVLRSRRINFTGSLDAPVEERTFPVQLQPGDLVSARVRRSGRGGGAPEFSLYSPPAGNDYRPSQRLARRSSSARSTPVFDFGEGAYVVGPREGEQATGTFKGTITIRPGGPYGRTTMTLVNPPGIPLSVRDVDAYIDVPWATSGAGVDFDGQYVLVTGEKNGQVYGKYYESDLADPAPTSGPHLLVSTADLSGGQGVQGHRLAFQDGFHYIAFSSADGKQAALARFPFSLTRDGFVQIVSDSPAPTQDLFLALDPFTVSVGLPLPPNGHSVHQFDAATLVPSGAATVIGDAVRQHAAGASAVYRGDQNVFEFWGATADAVSPSQPSDLGHGLFSQSWTLVAWDAGKVAEPETETRPTSVVYDDLTGVTIVHYVQPTVDATGFGVLHRRLYDALGVEVPDSHATLGVVRRDRPAVWIGQKYLWLAAEGLTNTSVTRYALLRR